MGKDIKLSAIKIGKRQIICFCLLNNGACHWALMAVFYRPNLACDYDTRLLNDKCRLRYTEYEIEVYNLAFLCIDFTEYVKEPFTERFLSSFICRIGKSDLCTYIFELFDSMINIVFLNRLQISYPLPIIL